MVVAMGLSLSSSLGMARTLQSIIMRSEQMYETSQSRASSAAVKQWYRSLARSVSRIAPCRRSRHRTESPLFGKLLQSVFQCLLHPLEGVKKIDCLLVSRHDSSHCFLVPSVTTCVVL